MGRLVSSGEEAIEKLKMAQGQFDTVNADFIFNFPTQTIAQFEKDVATFKALGLDQATFYPLMPSPHKKSRLEDASIRSIPPTKKNSMINFTELYQGGYKLYRLVLFSR